MNPKTVQFQYDINRMDAVNLVATIHIDDYDTRFLEVLLCERGGAFDVSGSTAAARFVTLAGELLNDSVPCTVEGNAVTVPVDAAAVKSQACTLKIEINLTKDGKVLTLPFPLWIRVRGSILDDAHITPESEGTIADLLKAAQEALDAAAAALEDAGDYSKLDNKPQINGVELVGDKSASELGLQDKLTAGDNVTIDENGVISVEGGTDDYNALVNKPRITGVNINGYAVTHELKNLWDFTSDFLVEKASNGERFFFNVARRYFQCINHNQLLYDFNEIPADLYRAGVLWFNGAEWTLNFPEALSEIDRSQDYFICQYVTGNNTYRQNEWTFRKVIGKTANGEYVEFAQMYACKYPVIIGNSNKAQVTFQTPWKKITGGSEIASAAVNQNGTITSYDKDGNPLFTTSGKKMVTSGNQQISMGYDSGGFYFLFDDGQEVINDGSN